MRGKEQEKKIVLQRTYFSQTQEINRYFHLLGKKENPVISKVFI